MHTLLDTLNIIEIRESIFDTGSIDAGIELDAAEAAMKQYLSGDYKIKYNKKIQAFDVKGNIVISGVETATLPKIFCLNNVKGNITIVNCPGLTTLEGLFCTVHDLVLGRIQGNIIIESCPKLISTKGLPDIIDGNLTLSNLQLFNNLDSLPKHVFGTLNLFKLKKRYKESHVASKTSADKIYCSINDKEPINEALNEPHLNRLFQQLVNDGKDCNLRDMCSLNGIAVDKLNSTNAVEYNYPFDGQNGRLSEKIAGREIHKVAQGKYNCIIAYDTDGKVRFVGNKNKYIYILDRSVNTGKDNGRTACGRESFTTTNFISFFIDPPHRGFGRNYTMGKIVIIDAPSSLSTYNLTSARFLAKKDSINQEDYANILKQNRERYTQAISALKEARKTNEYKNLALRVANINDRLSRALVKMVTDIKSQSSTYYYSIDSVITTISDMNKAFSNMARYLKKVVGGDSDKWDRQWVDEYREKVETYAVAAEKRLDSAGV